MKQVGNIYLIGLMGAGKTTMGKKLARALAWPFYDSDRVIEESTGVSIPMIFEYEGEQGFRDREQEVIARLTGLKGIVLATGGGAVLREENRRQLKDNGFVVYLQCSIDRILQRTRRDSQRPLLQTENPRQKLEQLFKERDPLYRECADITLDTGIMPSKVVLKTILREFNRPHLK
jgi:shikimate kinase